MMLGIKSVASCGSNRGRGSLLLFRGLSAATNQTARASSPNNKSLLMRLRKESGFPFGKCKAALEKSGFDLGEAHRLLQLWAKEDSSLLASKLASRSTKEGLLSVATQGAQAVVLEVNCETDFVSRNDLFQRLSLDAVSKIFHSLESVESCASDESHVSLVDLSANSALTELKGEVLTLLKENIVYGACRLIMYEKDVSLYSAVHPVFKPAEESGSNSLSKHGKYVSIVALRSNSPAAANQVAAVGPQLAYHVIAMSPKTLHAVVGSPEGVDSDSFQNASDDEEEKLTERDENEDEFLPDQQIDSSESPFENLSEAFVEQKFLFQSDITVGEFCDNLGIEIVNYHRFELK